MSELELLQAEVKGLRAELDKAWERIRTLEKVPQGHPSGGWQTMQGSYYCGYCGQWGCMGHIIC